MTGSRRERLDVALVRRGLADTRARAQAAIAAGLVRVDGRTALKPAGTVVDEARIEAAPPHPWVSRGGIKLAAALDLFGIDPAGRDALDVGASTGGFSDVLLARGARSVLAVDVGRGQLHPRVAGDPRLRSLEGVDARSLRDTLDGASFDLLVVDVSFISLRLVLPGLVPLLRPGAEAVLLVKPQFEVGRAGLARGGLVRDPASRQLALDGIAGLLPELGLVRLGVASSPIAGGDGNEEFLLGACRG